MCGFAGILSFSASGTPIGLPLLKSMSDVIAHRGPDDEGHYISPDGRLGFAFRRLSIVDLSSAGHQPMQNADGSVTIVFNGEIYNHLALRAELENAGYSYRSRTDTETLIYAYEHWGEDFVTRLEGMFAIAIRDERRKLLFLYRDRIGIKPLYHASPAGLFVFGSEIKSLLQHPAIVAETDRVALYHYFTFIHTPSPATMFRGISKLRPGHMLRIDESGNMQEREYWDVRHHRNTDFDYGDADAVAKRLLHLFEAAVGKRMMSDVPFGVFLSGGIDSTANVAVMSRLMDRPVDTFTVAIEGQEDTNEFMWARKVAALYGANHHEIVIDQSGFLDLLPAIVHHQDEPLADPVCFPLYHVSKLARDNGTIVIQVGEGSDELFSGYLNYLRAVRLTDSFGWIGSLPTSLTRAMYAAAAPLLKMRRIDYRQNIIRNLFEHDPVFWGNAIAFYEREKRRFLAPLIAGEGIADDSYRLVRERLAFLNGMPVDSLYRFIYWELKNRLAELLLMRVDKMTMAVSVEARVPFLDHALVEFAMNIPASLKVANGITKGILKRALRGVIPDEIIDRKKIGFAGSGKNMLTPQIFAHARSLVTGNRHGYYNMDYVRGLFGEYERNRINYTPQIWAMYNFELWHRRWIEGDHSIP